jgi:hypothetical protein
MIKRLYEMRKKQMSNDILIMKKIFTRTKFKEKFCNNHE